MTDRRLGVRELAGLLGAWPASGVPAYAALAARVRLLVLDGRLPVGVRLPPERALAATLGLSRTTVSAAYDVLRESGHAASRQGSGTWTSLPSSGAEVPTWAPEPAPAGVTDLAHAAPAAPPQLHAAYTAALEELPLHLPGSGYDYRGLVGLREALARRFTERGLPTTPEQVLVTSGALQAVRLALGLVVRPGDRVVVEQPGYPNGLDAVRDLGGRPHVVPVDPRTGRWQVASLESPAGRSARAAYLVPDFHNPTGALMDDDTRARVAQALARSGAVAVIDETLVELALDDAPLPAPFARHAPAGAPVVTVGSASKIFWGGLRVGWLRLDAATVARLAALRSRLDLAGPLLEQLAVLHLMRELPAVRTLRSEGLRRSRDTLAALLREQLPSWRFEVPAGGQVLWCGLPAGTSSTAVATAAGDLGVRLTPGTRFAADGTLESWLRLPFTRAADDLARIVPVLAQAWAASGGTAADSRPVPEADAFVV
ncbi:MAG: PLP-dependent aminotransferase family protein [Angustibacter sp.]